MGGTNAHIVLESVPDNAKNFEKQSWNLLTVSAKTEESLDKATNDLLLHLKGIERYHYLIQLIHYKRSS